MKRRIMVILVVIALFITTIEDITFAYKDISNNGGISFKRITIEDGLSQTTVEYIYQDSDGYMWFGTDSGLNKYDGVNFTVYRYRGEGPNSISGDIIISIIEDEEGYLWVGTTTGLNRIDRRTGEIKWYLKNEEEGSISSDNICEIFIDSKGKMWISTADGINIYNKETDDFTRILDSEDYNVITSQKVFSIVEDENDIYWIATDKGLNRYDEKTGDVKQYVEDDEDNKLINSNYIYDLFMDKNNILWVSTIGGGLNKIDTKSLKSDFYVHNVEDKTSIPSDEVNSVIRTQDDCLWVATAGGLAFYNDDTEEFTTYNSKIYDSSTLANDYVISLFESKLGSIWVGTDNGLCMFNPNDIFTTYRSDPLNENTIKSNMIQGIYKDNEGYIWIGTKDCGVNIIDRENDRVYRLDKEGELNQLLNSERITVINGVGNNILIGTNNGLNILNKVSGKLDKYLYYEDGSYNYQIRDIFIDSKGLIWIATYNGIFVLDKDYKLISKNYILDKAGVSEEIISTIYEDKDGEIWIGLGISGGVVRYNVETDTVTNYRNKGSDENSLSYNSVKDINEDDEGNIWIGTTYGLNKLNKNTGEFTVYLEEDGLANNTVYGILFDSNGNPWMSTNNGISKYDIQDKRFITFSVSDGLQGSEFNAFSYYKADDGEMFFGGLYGLNSFYPENYEREYSLETVRINEVEIDGESVNLDDEIVLSYKNNNINISYFLPDYRNIKKTRYVYMMEGIDKDWINAQNRNYINYNNFPSGKYTFKVIARNSNGQWSEVTSFDIVKKTSPWKSNIAYIIYFLILIYILYNRWNRVKLLNKLVEERTGELNNKMLENKMLYEKVIENEKSKNNYFINLSHELRTPLNVILSIEQLITTLNSKDEHIEKYKLSHYMKVLRGNSNRLLKLINDIIDTTKIEAGAYKLEIGEHDIVYHVEELALSMKDFIESKEIELIIDPEIEEQIIECDLAEIEKCVVNVLGNATKFTDKGGSIYIYILKEMIMR